MQTVDETCKVSEFAIRQLCQGLRRSALATLPVATIETIERSNIESFERSKRSILVLIPQVFKNGISHALDVIHELRSDAASLVNDVGSTLREVDAIIDDATELVAAITDAPEKLFNTILDKVIPTNAEALANALKIPDFNATASLGASAPSVLLPEHENQLRSIIRASLGVEPLEPNTVESVSEHHERLAREARGAEPALGGDDEGACVPLEISPFKEFARLTSYEMPWPEKLKNDRYAPDALEINLPAFTFQWCVNLEFRFPLQAAQALVDAFIYSFGDVIRAAIVAGLDAVDAVKMSQIKDLAQRAKTQLQCVANVVNDVQNLANDLDSAFSRRLLAEESAAFGCAPSLGLTANDLTHEALVDPASLLNAKLRGARDEARALVETHASLKERHMAQIEDSVFASVSMLQHVFSRSDLGALGPDGEPVNHLGHVVAAKLGFNLDASKERFERAMRKMKGVTFGFTLTQKMNFQTGVKVRDSLFRHGDLLDIFDPDRKMRDSTSLVEAGVPSVPLVSAYSGIDMGIAMPYFFKADAAGEYSFEVEVETKAFFGIMHGKVGSKTYDPVTSVRNSISGSIGASLQVGASLELREFTAGVCVLFVCTGPRMYVKQDVFLGFDVLAGGAAGKANCVYGPTELRTTFTDWDYSKNDKKRCRLRERGSFLLGGYMQIPRMAASVTLTTSLGTHGPGFDKPWHDFEIEKLMYGEVAGEGNFYLNKLFDPVCSSAGGTKLQTCEAPSEECFPTAMAVSSAVAALPDTSQAGEFGAYLEVAGRPNSARTELHTQTVRE